MFRGRWWGSPRKENKGHFKNIDTYMSHMYDIYQHACACVWVWAWIGPKDYPGCRECERLAWLPGFCTGHQETQENQRDEELQFRPDELKVPVTHTGKVVGKEVKYEFEV